MAKLKYRREKPFYLIPIMIGMLGVLFSSQLEDPILQGVVVLLCVAVPLFLGGNLLARIRSGGLQRVLLIAAMVMLTLGAVVTVSGYTESLVESEMVSPLIGTVSWWLGIGSLLLGLLVVIFSLVRSEDIISELSERFYLAADHMGEGLVILDHENTIVYANRAFIDMAAIGEETLLGRDAVQLAREKGVEAVPRHTADRTKGFSEKYNASWPSGGELRHYEIINTPIRDKKTRRAGTLLSVRDVTAEQELSLHLEKQAELLERLVADRTARLQQSEKRFRDLLVNMEEGFLTLDAGRRVRFVNDRFQQMLRLDDGAILGRDAIEFVAESDRERLLHALDEALQSGQPSGQEYTFLGGEGGGVAVKVSIAPVDGGAEEGRYSLVITDVQELKSAQASLQQHARELEELNEQLREMDHAKDGLLSNVSHELRTPLSTLQGYLEMWLEGTFGNVGLEGHEALDVMQRNAQRLSTMINELIEFSKIELRGLRLVTTLFHPKRVLDEQMASFAPSSREKRLHISVEGEQSGLAMWGDREKLGQAVAILVSNAIKFSGEGGRIGLAVAADGADGVQISVSDEGIGIDSAFHELIFHKFYQVDSSLTRHYQGTGIGLSILKSIIEAHGGHIDVESAVNEGAEFRLRLPNCRFDRVGEAESRPVPLAKSAKLLLVVHHGEFQSILRDALTEGGYEVVAAESGHASLRIAESINPDAAVVDEALDDLSCWETAGRLARELPGVHPRVVCLVSRTGAERDESLRDSDVDVIWKPFTSDELLEAVLRADSGAARLTRRV